MGKRTVVLGLMAVLTACVDSKGIADLEGLAALGVVGVPSLSHAQAVVVAVNGSATDALFPGVGTLKDNGRVAQVRRWSSSETGGSYSCFGISQTSNGEFWTSCGSSLVQFDPESRRVMRSLPRTAEAFLVMAFDSDDRLIGWSNGNGYLYEITLHGGYYDETQLAYVGLNAGGLTGLAFAPDGTLWGTDNRNKRLLKIDLPTGTLTTVAQLPWGSYIGLAFASDGSIFTSNSIARTVIQFDQNGNMVWEGPYASDWPILGIEFKE